MLSKNGRCRRKRLILPKGGTLTAYPTLDTHSLILLGALLVGPNLILEGRLDGLVQDGLHLPVTRTLLHDAFHVLVIHAVFVPVRTGPLAEM